MQATAFFAAHRTLHHQLSNTGQIAHFEEWLCDLEAGVVPRDFAFEQRNSGRGMI